MGTAAGVAAGRWHVCCRRRRQRRVPLWLVVLSSVIVSLTASSTLLAEAAPADGRLYERRAERRAAMRLAVAAKAAGEDPALFGLLIIPVDFTDTRLPAGWDGSVTLGPRLFPPTGETLASYFRIASGGRVDLRITLVPLVHLAGERGDYSDVGLGGSGVPRSRAMATEAITAVRDLGLPFRELDMEGPDRRPGTADDDGEVDGVLILHAGIGIENDPTDGLIQPLQFYLDPPVVDRGVQASAYAVASLTSGLGIWAHETGHLLGLEDRYDPAGVPDAGDVTARGGLGVFSLMAAGAWGTGQGAGPALLDAYSCLQLGWCDLRQLPTAVGLTDTLRPAALGGFVGRLWTSGQQGTEYFLVENRGGTAVAPFDAALPGGQLLIYHVDESLAEGEASGGSYPERHLRVAVVEADGDDELSRPPQFGLGGPSDLFPGTMGVTAFGPDTDPASDSYDGLPTEVRLTGITSLPAAVMFTASCADDPRLTISLAFGSGTPAPLQLSAHEIGPSLTDLRVTIDAVAPAGGQFASGGTSVTRDLIRQDGSATWELTGEPVLWLTDFGLPPGSGTRFALEFAGTASDQSDFLMDTTRYWIWIVDPDVLDFTGDWPGSWQITHPDQTLGTTWHRWSSASSPAPDASPLLVCSGAAHSSGVSWPDIHYENRAHAVLTSAAIAPQIAAVRLVHFVETEVLTTGIGIDGCVAEWVGPDDVVIPAVPADGYPAAIDPQSLGALHGRPAFAGIDPLGAGAVPVWRVDLFSVPDGPGPFRLRLRLASNGLWRYRGWLVTRCDPLAENPGGSAFPVAWLPPADNSGPVLAWSWLWEEATTFRVEARQGPQAAWQEVFDGIATTIDGNDYQYALPAGSGPLGDMLSDAAARVEARITAHTDLGDVRSRTVVYYGDGGAPRPSHLGRPYPNPAHADVRIAIATDTRQPVVLTLIDMRGRLVRSWTLPGGTLLLSWDGRDGAGRPLPAGTYLFRLQDGSGDHIRKVTWLP